VRKQLTIQEILVAFGDRIKSSMYHVQPGIVQAYYAGQPGTVDVLPAISDVRFDPDDGSRLSEPWPIIPRVPVLYPSGGGFSITFPLAKNDKVILLAFDQDPTTHRQTGQAEDPQHTARHTGSYWCAIPADVTQVTSPTAGTTMKIGKGSTTIEIDGTNISLGGASVSDNVALASLVVSELNKIKTALASLTVTSGPGAGGTVTAGTPYASVGAVKSTLVKSG
jgi:hypothetical protein